MEPGQDARIVMRTTEENVDSIRIMVSQILSWSENLDFRGKLCFCEEYTHKLFTLFQLINGKTLSIYQTDAYKSHYRTCVPKFKILSIDYHLGYSNGLSRCLQNNFLENLFKSN